MFVKFKLSGIDRLMILTLSTLSRVIFFSIYRE